MVVGLQNKKDQLRLIQVVDDLKLLYHRNHRDKYQIDKNKAT